MAQSLSNLKSRIEECVRRRAALEERRTRAKKDLDAAAEALRGLGLKPGAKAQAAIIEAEAELERAIEKVETSLGLS